MTLQIVHNEEYQKWLKELKARIQSLQIKAAIEVNQQLLKLYWSGMKGFSYTNLFYVRKWVSFYLQDQII